MRRREQSFPVRMPPGPRKPLSVSNAGRLWPAAILLGLTLLFFWKIAFTGLILAGYDTFAYFYPYLTAASSAIRSLRLPLWNPDVFLGAPLAANLQTALFYPATLLFYVLPVPYALSYDIILHVFLAGVFTYVLSSRTLHMEPAGALASAIVFAFCGFLAAQAGHINQLSAAVWLPLLLFLFDRAYATPSLAYAILASFVVGLTLLAGHSQEAYMTLCVLGGYFAWQSIGTTRRALALGLPPGRTVTQSLLLVIRMLASALRANARGLATLTLVVSLGAGLAAVQMLPSMELASLSARSGGMGYRQAVSFSLNPLTLPEALLPGYWQNPFSEYVGYVGVIGLLLSALGAATHWRRPLAAFFVVLAVTGLLLALGGYTPVYIFGYALVPGFGLFRVPARWLYVYTFAMATLAGLGLDWLSRRRTANPQDTVLAERYQAPPDAHPFRQWAAGQARRLSVTSAAVLLSGLASLWAVHAFRWPAAVAWIALAAGGLWLIAAAMRGGQTTAPGVPMVALLILLTADLFAASRDMEYNHPTVSESLSALRPALAHLLTDQSPYRILSLSLGLFDPGDLADMRMTLPEQLAAAFATAAKNKEILAPNTPMLFGLESMDGYDGGILPLNRYVELQQLFLNPWQVSVDGRLREHLSAIPDSRLLGFLNVKYVIADKVNDVWVDNVYYDLGLTATLSGTAPTWQSDNLPGFPTTSFGVVSYLVGAAGFPDGTPVATLTVRDQTGETDTYLIRVGRDTAEGQYAGNSLAPVRHKQARIVSNWPGNPAGFNYFTKISLDRVALPRSIEVRYIASAGRLLVRGLSLIDDRTGTGQSLVVSSTGNFRLVHSGDVKLYENLDVLPRALVVHQAQILQTNRAVLDTLADPAFHANETAVLVSDGLDVTPLRTLSAGASDVVTITRREPERVEISTSLGGNGLLVLADMWYPGWRAFVDGKEQPIYRVDHVFRGVYVTAGSHTVEVVYDPGIWRWGALISAACLALALATLRLKVRGQARWGAVATQRPRGP